MPELRQLLISNLPSSLNDCFAYAYNNNDIHLLRYLTEYIPSLPKQTRTLFDLYKRTLLARTLLSPTPDLDAYFLYLEADRPPHLQFYLPRRRVLLPIVHHIEHLIDPQHPLKELFLSLPPRTGKTTLLIFLASYVVASSPESSNLYSAYSDIITKAFYNGVLEIIQDPHTYLWHDVFPASRLVQTNSAEETLNIDRKKHYPSLTCRSLYGTLNGACDCNGLLIADDLIGSIEEALNKDRLIASWAKVDNNLIPRAKQQASILWCGTRWSNLDPMALRLDLIESNPSLFPPDSYHVVNIPALSPDTDESNFEYLYGVGFDSDYYKQRRASFERNNDSASWLAQYMGEPIEREGALFEPESFRYYTELPDISPDRVFMALDPAFGGGDFLASPICFQYGQDIFVEDVVFDNHDKSVTIPLLLKAITKYNPSVLQVEANKSLQSYVEELRAKVPRTTTIVSKPAPTTTSKFQRIFDKAPDIREYMLFKEQGKRTKHYEMFMQNVFAYKVFAKKNQHDDAPDSLCMAMDMVMHATPKAQVFKRWV